MDYRDCFLPYARKIDLFLDQFFSQKTEETSRVSPVVAETWRVFKDFVTGGKRVRGCLVKLGYECFKKPDEKKLLSVSAAIEIVHGAILIHDDIIDASQFRHGRPTVHEQYKKKYYQKTYTKGNPQHYAESMALVVGLEGYFEAIKLLAQVQFPAENKTAAIEELGRFMAKTAYGEILDVDFAYRSRVSEKDVLLIHQLKTARYTLVGPLKIGGLLAGASESEVSKFKNYGFPVGLAFQIQDDILGMFGDEKKLGKSVGDDLKEGKNTFLYTQAFKKGNSDQKKRLKKLWGRQTASQSDLQEARRIIQETGSLEYSQKLAQNLVEKGRKAVPKITKKKSLQEVFYSLTDFIVQREK